MNAEEIIAILLQVGLITLFIGVFFFTYVSKIERDVTTKQIHYIVDSFTQDFGGLMPASVRASIASKMNSMSASNQDELDRKVQKNNDELKSKGIQVLILPVLLAAVVMFSYMVNNPIQSSTLYMVAASVIVVAITYTAFLHMVVNKYLCVDTNHIKLQIVEELQKYANMAPQVNIGALPAGDGALPEIPILPLLQ